jgi:hypothetical protein
MGIAEMVPLKSDVVEAYLTLLGREPESDATIRGMQAAYPSVVQLVAGLQSSAEWRQRQGFAPGSGDGFVDPALLERFRRDVPVKRGFVTDWTGVRIARKFEEALGKRADRLEPQALDGVDAALWTVLLRAVEAASDRFTIADIGAGWGRWGVAGAAAALARGVKDVHLAAVEAQPDRFAFLQQHARDNGLGDGQMSLAHVVAAPEDGTAEFPVVDVHSSVQATAAFTHREREAGKAYISLPARSLQAIWTGPERPVDVCLLQAARSDEILETALRAGTSHVRNLAVKTFDRAQEGRLLVGLSKAGWCLDHDTPSRHQAGPGAPVCVRSGLQVWSNPAASQPQMS